MGVLEAVNNFAFAIYGKSIHYLGDTLHSHLRIGFNKRLEQRGLDAYFKYSLAGT